MNTAQRSRLKNTNLYLKHEKQIHKHKNNTQRPNKTRIIRKQKKLFWLLKEKKKYSPLLQVDRDQFVVYC